MDILIYYMIVGLVINWGVALYTIFVFDEDHEIEVDAMNFFLTIPIWPITLWEIISATFAGRD